MEVLFASVSYKFPSHKYMKGKIVIENKPNTPKKIIGKEIIIANL